MSTDAELKQDVLAELLCGKLSDKVDSWHDRQVAANTAWAARGTTSVENLITVD